MDLRPQDLPRLRQELVRFGQSDLFRQILEIKERHRIFATDQESAALADSMARALALTSAELFYVGIEMCELVMVAAKSLPEFTLAQSDPPSRDGFAWLSVKIKDVDPTYIPVEVVAIGWRTVKDTLQISIFIERDEAPIPSPAVLQPYGFPIVFPLGSWEIPIDQDGSPQIIRQGGPDPTTDEKGRTTGVFSLAALKTLWLLMRQPLSQESIQTPDRAARRRAQREGLSEPPLVRVIALRRPSGGSGQPGEPAQWHHRWIVRGHWRNQPYGSERQLRRPIWISPFVKGPEGAPMIGGEKVYVVKTTTGGT